MVIFRYFIFLLLGVLPCYLSAQEKEQAYQLEINRADAAFASRKFNTAAQLYQKVYPKIKEEEVKQKVLFRIADSYRNSNNFKLALKWYEEVLNNKYPDPNVIYSYGQLLKNFERYDDASRAFYDYSFENPDDIKGREAQASCAKAMEWKASPLKYKVENVRSINSEQSDYAPFFVNGKLVFTSSRKEAQGSEIFEWTGQKYSDLFESTITSDNAGKPNALKALNSNFNEGAAWFDSTQTTVFYTQCDGRDGSGINCKIYFSYYQNGAWIEPRPLPFNNDSFSCGHPAFTHDMRRLYFSSNQPGGFGRNDIWYMDYDAVRDKWGNAKNLGPNVNSAEDEMFPFVDEKGIIYYSSKGKAGMGGLDLFKTEDSSGTFKVAENLRYPINSGGDDFGISFIPESKRKADAPIAYYSSNREGGVGDDDIYSISVKPFVVLVKGMVYERENNNPIAGSGITAMNLEGKVLASATTNEKGTFTLDLPLNQLYGVSATKDKFLSSAVRRIDTREIKNDTVIEVNFPMDPIPAEDVEIVLQGIYYDLDKYDIRPEAKLILDSLSIILKRNPTLVIELASHTDSRAPADYNMELSKKRAQSCVNYLVQKGIPKERLQPVGYGETKLVNDCSDGVDCSEEEHQQNRRTTIRVVGSDYKPKR